MERLDFLYQEVTGAIRLAELLEDVKSPATADAFKRVAHLELEITTLLPADSEECRIAMSGAVNAASKSGNDKMPEELRKLFAERYSREGLSLSVLEKLLP